MAFLSCAALRCPDRSFLSRAALSVESRAKSIAAVFVLMPVSVMIRDSLASSMSSVVFMTSRIWLHLPYVNMAQIIILPGKMISAHTALPPWPC